MKRHVSPGHREHRRGALQVGPGGGERPGGGQGRVNQVPLLRSEAQKESRPLEPFVAPLPGFQKAQQRVERRQQEERGQHLVVHADPAERLDRGTVDTPEDRREPARRAAAGHTRAHGGGQREIGELRREDRDVEGQGIQAEQAVSGQEKRALAPGPYGALGQWLEQSGRQVADVVHPQAQPEPREIVGAKPGLKAAPVDQ